jgi:hypothetical protein
MYKRIAISRHWLAILGAALLGCQSSGDLASLPDAVEPTSPATLANNPSKPAPDQGAAETHREPARLAAAQFVPPFPDRLELFEPPKRAQSTVRRDDEGGETVELKGFVNVDKPRVVLLIDGVIAPIPEGGEKYGVQVISIQPPNAVLQRGRSRWTATLE